MKFLTTTLIVAIYILAGAGRAHADELVLVSPHWEGIRYEFGEAFSDYYRKKTGREVTFKWLNVGGTVETVRYIRSQFEQTPESIGVDMLFGGGVDPFIGLKESHLLQTAQIDFSQHPDIAQTIGGVPLHDPDGLFYAPVMVAVGILCNREVLRLIDVPEPKNWEDLGSPKLRGWIGSADPRFSGSMHTSYEVILQAYGWERGWQALYKLGANIRAFVNNSIQVAKDVANGEVACGLSIDSYAWTQIKALGADKISYTIPDGLSVTSGDSVAILKGAPHAETARAFINFLFTEEAQRIWVLRPGVPGGPKRYELYRLPVMPKLLEDRSETLISTNPFKQSRSMAYDFALSSKRWNLVNDLLGVFIIDGQSRLKLRIPEHAPLNESEIESSLAKIKMASAVEHVKLQSEWESRLSSESGTTFWIKAIPSLVIIFLVIAGAVRRYQKK